MNKYVKIAIPALLLLTTSAFAQSFQEAFSNRIDQINGYTQEQITQMTNGRLLPSEEQAKRAQEEKKRAQEREELTKKYEESKNADTQKRLVILRVGNILNSFPKYEIYEKYPVKNSIMYDHLEKLPQSEQYAQIERELQKQDFNNLNDLRDTLQEEYANNKKEPQKSIYEICEGNKYCLANADLMFGYPHASFNKLLLQLEKAASDHKQALYNTKYSFAKENYKSYETLQLLELEQILELNSFAEFRDYITDVPLLDDSLKTAMELLDLYAIHSTSSKEEADALFDFQQAFPKTLPVCKKNLNMKDYGSENLCVIQGNSLAKKQVTKEIEKIFVQMNLGTDQASDNEYENAKQEIRQFIRKWKDDIWHIVRSEEAK